MKNLERLNPTVVGTFAILVWGISISVFRVVKDDLGILLTMGAMFGSVGLLGLGRQLRLNSKIYSRELFTNKIFYRRWFFFVLHEVMIKTAISIVQIKHLPLVILINYLWPTMIILWSVLIANVQISRWWAVIIGSLIVCGSMAAELLRGFSLTSDLFVDSTDCVAYLLAFIGALSWGLYCAFTRIGGESAGGGSAVPLFQLTLGLALPLSFFAAPPVATPSLFVLLLLSLYCVLQFGAYLSWDRGLRLGNIVVLSLCADFIPWISLLSSYLILGVSIEFSTILSAIALVCGAMVTRYGTLATSKT